MPFGDIEGFTTITTGMVSDPALINDPLGGFGPLQGGSVPQVTVVVTTGTNTLEGWGEMSRPVDYDLPDVYVTHDATLGFEGAIGDMAGSTLIQVWEMGTMSMQGVADVTVTTYAVLQDASIGNLAAQIDLMWVLPRWATLRPVPAGTPETEDEELRKVSVTHRSAGQGPVQRHGLLNRGTIQGPADTSNSASIDPAG
jgi:hypothetical protein